MLPDELDMEGAGKQDLLVKRLAKALRVERRRGAEGSWSYSLARHTALLAAYRSELDVLSSLQPATTSADVLAGLAPPGCRGRGVA